MTQKTNGLLRWQDFISSLQNLVGLGLFGERLKLRQQPDGTWQLMESIDEQEIFVSGAHLLQGNVLTPRLDLVEGVGVDVNGRLSTEDPPPTINLTDSQMNGPTTMAVVTSRSDLLSAYLTPAKLELLDGIVSGGDALNYFDPVGLITGGKVITLAR
jgi:hypothetical protein